MKIKILIVIAAIICGVILFGNHEESKFYFEDYVVKSGDTFWGLYGEYYSDMNYEEALYTFKKDNNMSSYQLFERTNCIVKKMLLTNNLKYDITNTL